MQPEVPKGASGTITKDWKKTRLYAPHLKLCTLPYNMISQVRGKVIAKEPGAVTVAVGGIGLKVFATSDTLSHCTHGADAFLYTYLAVRENALDLYGFAEASERNFFELLLSVPGIGPRSALSVLSLAAVEALRDAVAAGDTNYLTKVSGIGRKTAEKIVVELRDKLGPSGDNETRAGEGDVLDALRALGYSTHEAREALKGVSRDTTDMSDRVRAALKILGGNK